MSSKILKFGSKKVEPEVRTLMEMKEVIYDKKWFSKSENFLIYFMYRNLALNERDRKKLERYKIRYDITLIPPKMLGCEYVKTLGHYHPLVKKTKVSYPEIYEVLGGKAHYLLQNSIEGEVRDVILIEAIKGDVVLIPPGYGHITINPSKSEELKMANLVCREFSSLYEPIKERGGGAYFELEQGWMKNENYSNLPEMRFLKTTPKLKEIFSKNIYELFIEEPEKFEFLTKPQEHEKLFEKVILKS
jgi:glucose-6-phosphate isomerase